jgi:multimeric flavodoxin WrbA
LACYGCEKTGLCVVKDDMQHVYPLIEESEAIILATPIFFYGMSAQLKALIDRCQCRWCGAMLKRSPGQKPALDRGKGYMIAVGATGGKNVFVGAEWTAKYFYDALDMTYEGGLLVRGVDHKAEILEHPEHLQAAYNLGLKAVRSV